MKSWKPGSGSASVLWLAWIVSSCIGCGVFAHIMLKAEDKTIFMPGPLSDGHHQLSESCDSCHTDSFGGGVVLQESCVACHGDERKKPFDSHPKAKFADPRNADMLSQINATECVTCHVEHKPEITLVNGLTRPKDLCFHCHEAIAEERPSHDGMGFETCASSGCHNYHDNRALYTKFLVNRIDDPAILPEASVPEREFADMLDMLLEYPRDNYPVAPLARHQTDEPEGLAVAGRVYAEWARSGHAGQGVNCTACHVNNTSSIAEGHGLEGVDLQAWQASPGVEGCIACHAIEVETFGQGKHGMRLVEGLSPMKPVMARLQMHQDAKHNELTCNSCHVAHDYDVVTAAVESCLGCHADDHSVAYRNSKHYALWLAETEGDGEPGSGVSCATCHMPRVSMDVDDYNSRVVVDHNQSANLAPNSKMLRSACLECHGLEFSINALADQALITSNFQGNSNVKVESMSMARTLHEAHQRRKQGD